MRCPACDHVMRSHRSAGAIVARCTGCEALWIDAGEVSRWIRTRCPNALEMSERRLRGVTTTPTGACPACRGPMRLGLLHGLSFDQCGRCRGVFLSRSVADLIVRWAESGRPNAGTGRGREATGVPTPGIEAVLQLLSGDFAPW